MSTNKNKYFEVVTISSVSAPNMADARRAATSSRKVADTEVLGRNTSVNRIYAQQARTLADDLTTN